MQVIDSEPRPKLLRPKSLTGMVADELRARIVDGQFQLGMALSENALASDLGISKTPVREALLQLKLEGLVEIHPQRGSFVFQLAADQVVSITELREILELAALRLAMLRRRDRLVANLSACFDDMRRSYEANDIAGYRRTDGQFHDTIIESCGNEYFRSAYGGLAFRVQALRGRLSREAALNDVSYRDHRQILDLVKANDLPAVRRLLSRHINNTKQTYLDVLAGLPAVPPGPPRAGRRRP